ncbi:hypothetical protein BD560DRAFT_380697 [Blakeslea trispora]|nr:hypothetical protein BD560DRAFT_380697 [Blakeslea trispora]
MKPFWAMLPLLTVSMATTVKHLVVFGDSHSDVSGSDHPNWSEYLALGWNASLYSFAASGSICSTVYRSNETTRPSLKDQLEAYYTLHLDLKPEETVYAFWIGTQDVIDLAKRPGHQQTYPKDMVDCIGQQLRLARKVFLSDRFLVFNLSPFEPMPSTEESISLNQVVIDINCGLERDVANLNKHHHALQMDYVDIHSLMTDIVADPTIFRLKEPQQPYLDPCSGNNCESKAQDYLWRDKTHFTLGFHRMTAESIIAAESYMPKVSLTDELVMQLNDPHSKYHSKKYKLKPATDIVNEQAKLYDIQKTVPIQAQ